jgi:hypothetical protein
MEFRNKLAHAIYKFEKFDKFMTSMENMFFPDPLHNDDPYVLMDSYPETREIKVPPWLSEEHATISGPMPGYAMSFRTDIIRKSKFDEALGGYAFCEDLDASLNVMHNHLIVRSLDARVYHCLAFGKRVEGIESGMMNILNRAYIVYKHHVPGSKRRCQLKRYSYYKLARYLLQIHTHYGRHRVLGAFRALLRISILLNTPREELTDRYVKLRDECLRC